MADFSQPQATEIAPAEQRDDLERSANGGEIPIDERRAEEGEGNTQLLASPECTRLDGEWQAIQAGFVDSPRASVEKADVLVRQTIDAIAASFGDMRDSLEKTWEKDKEPSTEDLRVALQNYRSFFRRLLSV